MILDNLGIQVSLEEAVQRASEMYGVEADELDKAQQQAGMMDVVMQKLAKNTESMPEVMGTAAQQTASFQTQIANLKDNIGVQLLPILSQLLGTLAGFLEQHGPQMIAWVQTVASWIMTTLVPGMQQLWASIQPVVQTIAQFVSEHAEEFKTALIAIGAVLAGAAIASGIASIAGAIAALANPVTLVIAAVAALAVAWQNDFLGIQTSALAFWERIKPAFDSLITMFRANLPATLESLRQIWDTVWPYLQIVLQGAWEYMTVAVETAIGVIQGIIQTVMALIQGDWDTAWQTIKSTAETWLNGLFQAIGVILNTILTLFGTNLDTLKETVSTKIQAVRDAIVAKVQTFVDAGKEIIGGLKQGIEDAWGEIKSKILELADILPQWLKNRLGIASPSKVFIEIGRAMAAGIPVGMDKERASVYEKMGDWINSIVGAFTVLNEASMDGGVDMDAMYAQIDAVELMLLYAIDKFKHLENLFGYDVIKKLQNTAKRFKVILETVLVDLTGIQELSLPDLDVWFAQMQDLLTRSVTMIGQMGALVGDKLESTALLGNTIARVFRSVGAAFQAASDASMTDAIDSDAMRQRFAELRSGMGTASAGMQLVGAAASPQPISGTLHLVLDIPGLGVSGDTDVTIETLDGINTAQNLTLHASSKAV